VFVVGVCMRWGGGGGGGGGGVGGGNRAMLLGERQETKGHYMCQLVFG